MAPMSNAAATWDALATDMESAKAACWSEPDWDESAHRSADIFAPAIAAALEHRPSPAHPFIILDYGCGVGRVTIELAKRHPAAEVVGVDVSARMLAHAAERARQEGIRRRLFWSLVSEEFSGEIAYHYRFDVVVSMLVFQHLDVGDVLAALRAISSRMWRDGVFKFQFVTGDHHVGLDHRHRTTSMMGWLKSTGFGVTDIEAGDYPGWLWMTAVKL